ncbi:MAG: hypothetical protein ACFB15_06325 [Cyclobacteriaceae bacterium]
MKFFLSILPLFIISLTTYSQNQSIRTEEYCEVEVERTGSVCHIRLDFGQPPNRGLMNWVDKLRDSVTRRPLEFNSAMDALNYMNGQGWVLVQAYSSDSCNTRYIMRRSLLGETGYEVVPR